MGRPLLLSLLVLLPALVLARRGGGEDFVVAGLFYAVFAVTLGAGLRGRHRPLALFAAGLLLAVGGALSVSLGGRAGDAAQRGIELFGAGLLGVGLGLMGTGFAFARAGWSRAAESTLLRLGAGRLRLWSGPLFLTAGIPAFLAACIGAALFLAPRLLGSG
jgi:hypothetical protein